MWDSPGGHVEPYETPEEACVRELREETGYEVAVTRLICNFNGKFTFAITIVSGSLHVARELPQNADIIEARWVRADEFDKFDSVTRPIIDQVIGRVPGMF